MGGILYIETRTGPQAKGGVKVNALTLSQKNVKELIRMQTWKNEILASFLLDNREEIEAELIQEKVLDYGTLLDVLHKFIESSLDENYTQTSLSDSLMELASEMLHDYIDDIAAEFIDTLDFNSL